MPHSSGLDLPFAALNLRINPFGTLTSEERAQLAVVNVDLDDYANRLGRPGFALQFLGPSGRGKSTHLFAIHGRFPHEPFTYIPEDKPVPEIPDTPVQFIDEMQRIPHSLRTDILKRRASFVIGSHMNHHREFKKAGLEHEVIKLGGTTVELLDCIVKRRIEWARRDPGLPVPVLSEEAITNLIAAYGDDLWAIESHLYDLFQELTHVGEVRVAPPTTSKKVKRVINAALARVDGRGLRWQ